MSSIELLLGKLDGVRQTNSASWIARCPAHEDNSPSLSIRLGTSQPVLVTCFAGCTTANVLAAIGMTMADICTPREDERPVIRAASRPGLFQQPGGGARTPVAEADIEYDYTDEHGELLFQVVRKPGKKFRQRRPDGRGGWTWTLGETRRVPYRLPQLIDAVAAGRTIYIAEGEKDVQALQAAGFAATCNPGGAGKWRVDYSPHFAGAEVVVIADADEPGRKHAAEVASSLAGIAASVAIVEPAQGKDAADHLAAGLGVADFCRGEDADDGSPHLAAIPAYPVTAIAGPLRDLIDAAQLAGLHPALVAGPGLAALATLAAAADVEVNATWTERPVLWIPVIAPRGSGKSPAQIYAYRKLRELDAERLVDDVTLEMVARFLGEHDGMGGVAADELSGWLGGIGRYRSRGDGGERGRWLALWSAVPWRYQRVGGNKPLDIYIDRPVVTICGGLQPHLHHLLGGDDDGFRPRWLPHLAPLDTDLALGRGRETPDWDHAMQALADVSALRRTWTLTGEAYAMWAHARRQWKDQARGGETASVSAAMVKADMQSVRIALVLAESMAPGAGGDIPADAMHTALAITDYVMDCWRALPEQGALTLSRRDETLHHAVGQLAAWLEQRDGKRATQRDILRSHVAGVRTANDLTDLLLRYQAEYPGSVRETPSGKRGGRPGIVAHAPRRGNASSPRPRHHLTLSLSPGDKPTDGDTEPGPYETAGQPIAPSASEFVASGDNSGGDNSVATNTGTQGDGPCVRCGQLHNRYGPGGKPLCDDCERD